MQDIRSLTHDELVTLFKEMKQPAFRVKQVEQWLYGKGATSFDDMSNLPKALREALAENFTLTCGNVILRQVSADDTRKYLVEFSDGISVETVGIPSTDGTRLTVCFSTQAGCAMGCVFCATGLGGLQRNLSIGEMIDQVRIVAEDYGKRVTNVVAMGQGEPFANYAQVMQALKHMNNKDGLGIGARHITVSTCGLIKGIERFAMEDEQFTLAVSLHSAVQATRDRIMPGVSHQSLDSLKESLKHYGDTTKRRPSLEYAPMAGVNDSDEDLDALIQFCRGMLAHVNLIPLNPISPDDHSPNLMEPSPRIKEFEDALNRAGIEVSIRASRGGDIDGACGQLKQRVAK